MRPAQLAHQNRRPWRRSMTNAKAKAIWMPGKERPAASRLVIQKPPTTEPHHRNICRSTKPSAGQPSRLTAEGSRLPIPSEPAPCHRPWITPQGATPAERVQQYHAIKGSEHQRTTGRLAKLYVGKVKQSRLRPLSMGSSSLLVKRFQGDASV